MKKEQFKSYYRDTRIYWGRAESFMTNHISLVPEIVKKVYQNRSAQDETDLIQDKLIFVKILCLKKIPKSL